MVILVVEVITVLQCFPPYLSCWRDWSSSPTPPPKKTNLIVGYYCCAGLVCVCVFLYCINVITVEPLVSDYRAKKVKILEEAFGVFSLLWLGKCFVGTELYSGWLLKWGGRMWRQINWIVLSHWTFGRSNVYFFFQFVQTNIEENQNSTFQAGESRPSRSVPAHQALWTAAVVWEGHDVSWRGQVLQVVLLTDRLYVINTHLLITIADAFVLVLIRRIFLQLIAFNPWW